MLDRRLASRKKRLIKHFERAMKLIGPILHERYPGEAVILLDEARRKYEELIPRIPFLDLKSPLLDMFFFPATRHLAVYQVFMEHGKTLEEAGQVVYEVGRLEFSKIPRVVRVLISLIWFSDWFKKRLKNRARLSQAGELTGGYRVSYTEGSRDRNAGFDYEFDYHECAVLNFYRSQGAENLVPYVCAIDRIASEKLGWGLQRKGTLANGADKCDFRFKKGGSTFVDIPVSLTGKYVDTNKPEKR